MVHIIPVLDVKELGTKTSFPIMVVVKHKNTSKYFVTVTFVLIKPDLFVEFANIFCRSLKG